MYCGTSNIVLPVPNKSFFPPEYLEKTRLHYYASLFNSLEVNQTFYKVPRAATIARWGSEVPPSFRFSVKIWKGITHAKNMAFDQEDIKIFMETINAFGDKKGCLLIQFPAGIKAEHLNGLNRMLGLVQHYNEGWRIAVEFRHTSWYSDPVYRLLENYAACLVEHDMPASATPALLATAGFRFLRFHGPAGDYRGDYSDEVLSAYAQKINAAGKRGEEIYAYFNNTIGEAVHNALRLQEMMANS